MSSEASVNTSWDQLWNLTGRVALVTGGGTGIGRMIANGFASRGAKVYISGRRLDVLRKASETTFEGSGRLIPLQMDVTSKPSILAAVSRVKAEDGRLDILFNNAATDGPKDRSSYTEERRPPEPKTMGEYGNGWFENLNFEDWGSLAQTNVASVFFVTMAFLGLLEESAKHGQRDMASVINISSAGSHMHLANGYYPYQVLKAGTIHLTKVLATEFSLRQASIRVNGIAPGIFPSQLVGAGQQLAEFTKTAGVALNPIPMRRPGREEEMAALAIYLASPASAYTHGQEILIDGGLAGVNP